jgi:hypothetical protein
LRLLCLDDGRRLACVPCQERDGSGREHEQGADHERALVPVGRRLRERRVPGIKQRAPAGGGERGEDRQPERGAELLSRVQEPGGETGLLLVDAGVGRRSQTGEDPAHAE